MLVDGVHTEVLPPGMSETAAAPALSLLLERIVSAGVVAEKRAGRRAEKIEWYIAAAREGEGVASEALPDEGPDERL